ncbi:hypothetical protein LI951_14355 [Enterococcus sp. BWT-B8]|uniref:hypothetical protein n=1 Tax=Enterococcus sp. BWT-B8 TaxID=2885157 RepID=UPI001E298AE8|nr:hypothetical protein [Enterococcus sp. BWT-B8]MCB5953254.1 hypothetical protein [Enterococcus sp. BWT-B8]
MNSFVKSDIGAKAAWKGFSSQTTYIASRLIELPSNFELHPEKVEDLLITRNGTPDELIQIKNLTNNLTLSDLSPAEKDSFFRRCLSIKKENPNVTLKVVSFGKIGQELSKFPDNSSTEFSRIEKKLLDSGYLKEDIHWLSDRLSFEIVDEGALVQQIKECFSHTIETMAAPEIVLDILTQYVASLSRYSKHTNKILWEEKIQQIGIDLASLSGVSKEYGNSFIPMTEFKELKNEKQLTEEYLAGVNAQPQHIRLNLDIERSYWLDKIDESFNEYQFVLIKGASGQGKSTLAYRYLQNFYSENDILCIQSVTSESQAQDIVIALNGLAKKHTNLIVYFDVSPRDINWNWICEKHNAYGSNFKLLVSIREEDFRRTNFDSSKTPVRIIDLQLSKEEAELIFLMHPQTIFRSFIEAWRAFGEQGPMMEFVYLLNSSETLEQRLSFQVKRITDEKDYTEEWLKALLIISYAGQYGIDIDFQRLIRVCPLNKASTVLYLYEQEYLIKVTDENKKIESLHVLRAKILSKVLLNYLYISEEDIVFGVIESTFSSVLFLLVSFYCDNEINSRFINLLGCLHFNSWETYSSVIKSLLWLDVRILYLKNKSILEELDKLSPGNFPIFLLGDITGYIPNFDGKESFEFLREFQPERVEKSEILIEKIPQKTLNFIMLDEFINVSKLNLPYISMKRATEISSVGYSLFWFANRGVYLNELQQLLPLQLPDKKELLDALLNLAIGIQYQKWNDVYDRYYPLLLKMLKEQYSIVYLSEKNNKYEVLYLLNMYDSESASEQYSNESIMAVVGALRRIDITKKQYDVRLIGDKLHSDLETPEVAKNIKSEKLPWLWITEINGWFSKLHDYDLLADTWGEVDRVLVDCIDKNNEVFKLIDKMLNRLYKKGNLIGFDLNVVVNQINDLMEILNDSHLFYPKTSVDRYGIDIANYSLNPHESAKKNNEESLGFQKNKESKGDFSNIWRDFSQKLTNFYENMHVLLKERIKKEEVSQRSRVSYINLMDACDLLPKLCKTYETEFPLSSVKIISETELTRFRLISSAWSHLFLNEFRIDRSALYNRKEYIKRYLRQVNNFLNQRIQEIDGVVSCERIENHYEITVDIAENESFFTILVDTFKEVFPDIGIYTFENSLWNNEFEYLEIKQSICGYEIPPVYKIASEKFAYMDASKIEKYMMTYQTSKNVIIDNKLLVDFLGYNANQGDLRFIFNHLMDIFKNIESVYYKDGFEKEIYSKWSEKTESFSLSIVNNIFQAITQVNNYLYSVFGEDERNLELIQVIENKCASLKKIIQIAINNSDMNAHEIVMVDIEMSYAELQSVIQDYTMENGMKIQVCLEGNLDHSN